MIVDDGAVEPRRKLSLSDLPWDTVNIIFDFTPKGLYHRFRCNRAFTRLINKRRRGLTFKDKDVLPDAFMKILVNNELSLRELHVMVQIKRLKIAAFEQCKFRPKSLQVLDIKKLENISEKALERILCSSSGSLETLKLSYRAQQHFSLAAMRMLASCKKLKHLDFATLADVITNGPQAANLQNFKQQFLRRKKCSLQSLKLYDCDKEVLELLARGSETNSLEELQII